MIPLSTPLDDMDFDALVEIARERLPRLAPEWTDYNYSDPGITLVELLAWIADTQIYSIGRNRVDERIQMAGLLGIKGEGARPACGTLFARDPVAGRQAVPVGARLTAIGAAAPRVEVDEDVTLWRLEIASIRVESAVGIVDHTASNAQPRATFAPFGEPPSDDARLRVVLQGDLDEGPVEISLGFELEDDDASGAVDGLGGIAIVHVGPDGAESPVRVRLDATGGLRRSGAMILGIDAVGGPGSLHTLVFQAASDTLIPRLLRITPNALPVVQRATLRPPPFIGNGRPGQELAIEPLGLFEPDEAAEGRIWRLARREGGLKIDVRVAEGPDLRAWTPGEFREAGPADSIYSLSERADGSQVRVRFGNGVNGRRPPSEAQILVEMAVSAGKSGNMAAGLQWLLDAPRTRWENREPLAGGRDPDDLQDLLAGLRTRLRSRRTLATSRQIEQAARDLPRAYGVARAAVVEGWERGRRPASAATRTLIVVRKGNGNETGDWLRAIGRELRPRIALAERLRVEAPAFRDLRVRVRAVAAPGRAPGSVAEEIGAELAGRLRGGREPGAGWPFGQDVTALAIGGWIRRLAGVAALREVVLLDGRGDAIERAELVLARDELPRLVEEPGDIMVVTGDAR